MKAHRMPARKRAAIYEAFYQQRLIKAGHRLALQVLAERWEKWQTHKIGDETLIYTLEVLINENERKHLRGLGMLTYDQHRQIAEDTLREWKAAH